MRKRQSALARVDDELLGRWHRIWYTYSMPVKYTRELLEPVVAASRSYAEVLRNLGVRQAGGSQSHVKRRIVEFGIDTSHFGGEGWAKGTVSPRRKSAEQILVVLPDGSARPKHHQLKRALLDSGVPYECAECKNPGVWQDRELVLEVDHTDGNWLNNVFANLRLLCPNCHSQQESNRPWKFTVTGQ